MRIIDRAFSACLHGFGVVQVCLSRRVCTDVIAHERESKSQAKAPGIGKPLIGSGRARNCYIGLGSDFFSIEFAVTMPGEKSRRL